LARTGRVVERMSTNTPDPKESFECPECGKVLPTERGRDSHVEQIHGREYHDEELLRELYVEKELSSIEIADRYGVGDKTIRNALERNGIEVRSTGESLRAKSPPELKNENWLRQRYKIEGKKEAEIAESLGCSQWSVNHFRRRHGIEANEPPSGQEHYNYKSNTESIDYGDNWHEKRREALERDGHECQACGVNTEDCYLDVHHIRPIKRFDTPERANTLDNLVCLCRSCHRQWEGIPLRPELIHK